VAYLALARKYRPQRFADMIGQEHVTRTLENAIKSDRVHHAYLFCGVRGLGKTTAARILAKALVCEQGPTPEPCNECSQCVAINEGRSVDVIEIDGASNNSVEDIRSLRDQVNYLPQSARRKIYIIDEVHMLTQQAFNALLKTLEEPPAHVTFMFATTDPHKVLPTILSRVSRLDYRRVRAATLVPYLEHILEQEGFAVESEGLHVVARCGEGSVRDSLTLLDKVIAFAQDPKAITTQEVLMVLGQAGRFAVAQLVQAVLERDAQQVLARFEDMTSTGSDLMKLAVAILQHLRDLAVVKLTSSRDALLDMSDDLYEQLQQQAAAVEATVIAQHFDRFSRVVESLENSRVPRLVIEMGLLELCNAEPLLPLGDLVARLDALAAGRGGGGGGYGGGGGARRGGGRPRRLEPEPRPSMRADPAPAPASTPGFARSSEPTPGFARSSEPPPYVGEAVPGPRPEPPGSTVDPRGSEEYGRTPREAEARSHERAPRQDGPRGPEASGQDGPGRAEVPAYEHAPRQDEPARAPAYEQAPRQAGAPSRASAQPSSDDEQIERLEALARAAGLLPGGPSGSASSSRGPAPRPASPQAGANMPPRDEAQSTNAGAEPAGGFTPATAQSQAEVPTRPEPSSQPVEGDPAFELTNDTLAPTRPPSDPEAGCPSSRCTPREPVPWRELEPWDAWESFLGRIRDEHDLLWAVLLDLGLVRIEGGTVVLGSPATGFAQTQLRENPELKTAFAELTAHYFGEAMRLELLDATPALPDMPSLALVDEERHRRHRESIARDAEHNPRIRSLLSTFSAQLLEVRPLEGPQLPPLGQRGLPGARE
jgi:DNA polymerase-3 subunit gamma/tau